MLKCVQVGLQHSGPCTDGHQEGPTDTTDCGCPLNLDPVCGRDLVTYPSLCVRKCKNAHLKHRGSCESGSLLRVIGGLPGGAGASGSAESLGNVKASVQDRKAAPTSENTRRFLQEFFGDSVQSAPFLGRSK
ncbi:kazal-type serine protease inhibitor domain-containing protein [Cystoisospora suis]|uniref:Kazal-type serine protease inhibitor domain-containing protein n=1 Tax=Cystoisospora suis TaxID=483139 RepID=A0A2C6KHJ7_9APIC|nr:kazal-type serine protease inhibitor domain-containing protein [Cystoisospora suis]